MNEIHVNTPDRIQILTTMSAAYLPHLQVLLTSIRINQPGEKFDIRLMHSGIHDDDLEPVIRQCSIFGYGFHPVLIDASAFTDAPVSKQYPKEMYYRLLAPFFLPDQDVLNAMYGSRTFEIDDSLWNYDARNYNNYLLRSMGGYDMDWVMANTVILHFCGKSKPWQKGYIHRFGILYKHYSQLTRQIENSPVS